LSKPPSPAAPRPGRSSPRSSFRWPGRPWPPPRTRA
jgi:hypothetical protein